MTDDELRSRLEELTAKAGLESAVEVHDYETGAGFSHRGDRWFHAASTMKAAVLYALLEQAGDGEAGLDDPLHVRNRFQSVADDSVFRVAGSRDGDSVVHRRLGKTMTLEELAHAMITRSSNLATNLLVDFLGVEVIRAALEKAGVEGVDIVRGVEDDRAFEAGINSRVTARGLVALFRKFCEPDGLSEDMRALGMDILHAQEFNRMIPAGLPDEARVAHKTGEISSVSHDAGIVTLPNRQPYVLAILCESEGAGSDRKSVVVEISRLIFEHLTGEGA